jgi:predicted Rossmann fold nucleotide-binding protein DprA/Smf involved in DNA uptake
VTAKDKNAVAIVGSRQTTHYGIEVARKLAYQLAYVGRQCRERRRARD